MRFATLGDFDTAVLLAVARLHDDAYGMRIRQDVSARVGRDCTVGAIYATLQRLEDRALVTARMIDPTAARGGRAKRCYRLTALADEALRASRASVMRVRTPIDAVCPVP